jgi:hypothetical protein
MKYPGEGIPSVSVEPKDPGSFDSSHDDIVKGSRSIQSGLQEYRSLLSYFEPGVK